MQDLTPDLGPRISGYVLLNMFPLLIFLNLFELEL